ncbi:MAG: hypothetical protein JSU04_05005 [Bdellovibrionales bacterium]|nr:hypothetical protein [Bdellovibrionales bacterium]
MKQFLAVYMGSATDDIMKKWMAMDENTRKEKERAGMQAWGKWVETHKKSIVVGGGPLGKTKKADPSGITDIKNLMTGYTVVQAETHEEAAKMFKEHPHFSIFPGASVEIMEVLPIPGM